MTDVAQTQLAQWLLKELEKRHISARRASLEAGLNPNAVRRYIKGRQPAPAACRKLASYFGVPEDFVLHLAGHITLPETEKIRLKLLQRAAEGLPDEYIDLLIQMAQTFRARHQDSQ